MKRLLQSQKKYANGAMFLLQPIQNRYFMSPVSSRKQLFNCLKSFFMKYRQSFRPMA